MLIISRIRDYIIGLDNRRYKIFLLSFLASVALISFYLVYRRNNIYTELRSKLESINKQRKRAKNILQQSKDLQKQREEVDVLLSQDKDFRLLDYFNKFTRELYLTPSVPASVSAPKDLGLSYNEVELSASFSNLNTKQLIDLLEVIDKNRRVYIKELIIDKSQKSQMLDIKLIIGTLEPVATV